MTLSDGGSVAISSRVPHRSVIGLTLWNILYSAFFGLELGDNSQLIGFTDDLALTVTVRSAEVLVEVVNQVLKTVD